MTSFWTRGFVRVESARLITTHRHSGAPGRAYDDNSNVRRRASRHVRQRNGCYGRHDEFGWEFDQVTYRCLNATGTILEGHDTNSLNVWAIIYWLQFALNGWLSSMSPRVLGTGNIF